MKKIFFIQLFFTVFILNAQQIAPLKEAYDDYLEKHYTTNAFDYSVAINRPCCWPAWGDILSSYLNMFKATGDKAYLNKFVKHAYNILEFKGQNSTYPYFWDFTSYGSCPGVGVVSSLIQEIMSFHYTGRILKPMAEYIYMVKQVYPNIQNTEILPSLGLPYTTYDNFANYVQNKVEETLDYTILSYWVDDNVGFSKTKDSYTFCEINQQASWGCSFLYMSKVNNSKPYYTTIGIAITEVFRNELIPYSLNGSYTWFHNGKFNFREDVSHGATDLCLVMVGYELYGNGLWSTDQLTKFAHTFTYNIWDRNKGRFTNNVFGMLNDNDSSQSTCGIKIEGTPNFWGGGEILSWIPIYQWDDINAGYNSVYNLLLNQTVNLITQNYPLIPTGYCHLTCSLSGSQSLEAFSQVVRAQWREECINLTLRNRHLTFNQDFNVKSKLVVDPFSQGQYCSTTSQNYPSSFADPIITDNKFIIDSGITVNMIAGESIVLLSGFEARLGSTFSASINQRVCNDGMYIGNLNSGNENIKNSLNSPIQLDTLSKIIRLQNTDDSITSLPKSLINSFSIYPNPSYDMVYISFSVTDISFVTLNILDQLGKTVFNVITNQKIVSGNYVIPLDVTELSKGIYFCSFHINGHLYKSEKIKIIEGQ